MVMANLSSLVGRSIRVDRGGPESRLGKLIAVKDDHIVVFLKNDVEEGMLYYKTDHIKSLSLETRYVSAISDAYDESAALNYVDEPNFASIITHMKFRWVQINRGGPEKLEGVLIDATDDQITLISGNEIVQVLPFHIRNISYGIKKQNDQDQNNNQNNNKDKQNENKQDGNKQNGNKQDGNKNKNKNKK
jgi:spore coat protein B